MTDSKGDCFALSVFGALVLRWDADARADVGLKNKTERRRFCQTRR